MTATMENILVNKKSDKKSKEGSISYGTGKRKRAIARVWLKRGKGNVTINKQSMFDYFNIASVPEFMIQYPFNVTETTAEYDVVCTVKGSGVSAQVGAIVHGISRALSVIEEDFKRKLRSAGLMTRDSRKVERKKYGQRKARKSVQFSKR
ncbi:MAG: 30S ribosomal protein S9 [Rickettsiaceae bacterium]